MQDKPGLGECNLWKICLASWTESPFTSGDSSLLKALILSVEPWRRSSGEVLSGDGPAARDEAEAGRVSPSLSLRSDIAEGAEIGRREGEEIVPLSSGRPAEETAAY